MAATWTMYGLYAAGFLIWSIFSERVSRETLIGLPLALVIAVTLPSLFGVYGAVIGVYLFIAVGIPAVGALVASVTAPGRRGADGNAIQCDP